MMAIFVVMNTQWTFINRNIHYLYIFNTVTQTIEVICILLVVLALFYTHWLLRKTLDLIEPSETDMSKVQRLRVALFTLALIYAFMDFAIIFEQANDGYFNMRSLVS